MRLVRLLGEERPAHLLEVVPPHAPDLRIGGGAYREPAALPTLHIAHRAVVVFVPVNDALLRVLGLATLATSRDDAVRGLGLIEALKLGMPDLSLIHISEP